MFFNVKECDLNSQISNCSSFTYLLYDLGQVTSTSLNFLIYKLEIRITPILKDCFYEVIHVKGGQRFEDKETSWPDTRVWSWALGNVWSRHHHVPSSNSLAFQSHFCAPSYLSAHTQSLHIALDFCMVLWSHSLRLLCQRSCMGPHGIERAEARWRVCTGEERNKVSRGQSLRTLGSWGICLRIYVAIGRLPDYFN